MTSKRPSLVFIGLSFGTGWLAEAGPAGVFPKPAFSVRTTSLPAA